MTVYHSQPPWTTMRYHVFYAVDLINWQLVRDFIDYKSRTKSVIKSLASQTEPMASIETGHFFFHVLIAENVGYIGLCDRLYPKKLAFALLGNLQREFHTQFGQIVESAARPYAFIKFDSFIQKAKRSYQDVRARQNLDRLQEELLDVTKIMTTSINDVLERGSKLENMSLLSNNLSQESRRYLHTSRRLNVMMLWRKYGPLAFITAAVVLFFYLWFRFL